MEDTRARLGDGVRLAARQGPRDVARLTARIRLLLEEAAHQGALALRLLVQARELDALAARGDGATAALVRDLERRLCAAERTGRVRVRRARLTVIGRPGAVPAPRRRAAALDPVRPSP
jgi:hypothetical protein